MTQLNSTTTLASILMFVWANLSTQQDHSKTNRVHFRVVISISTFIQLKKLNDLRLIIRRSLIYINLHYQDHWSFEVHPWVNLLELTNRNENDPDLSVICTVTALAPASNPFYSRCFMEHFKRCSAEWIDPGAVHFKIWSAETKKLARDKPRCLDFQCCSWRWCLLEYLIFPFYWGFLFIFRLRN